MAVVARLLGLLIPIWLITMLGTVAVGAAGWQDRLLQRGRFGAWMPAFHLNLNLLMLTVWIVFSGGAQSPFIWIYAIAVAIYGLLWGRRWALGTAAICGVQLVLAALVTDWIQIVPAGPTLLVPPRAALGSHIAMFFLVAVVSAALRERLREMFTIARTDPLTGLGNRQELRQALDREVARAAAMRQPVSVFVIELDHFKAVNDRFGHLQGDDVLRRVAAIMRASCRASDILARFGGDEFVALLPGADQDAANDVAERVRNDIEEQLVLADMRVTASIGVATFPTDAATVHDLLEAADRAVYYAKATGGNRVTFAS